MDSLGWDLESTMTMDLRAELLPIADSDEIIRGALESAHLPSLIAALVHVTGDASLVAGDIKPIYDFFGDGQGGLTEEQRSRTKELALAALKAYRDRGHKLPPQPSFDDVRSMMSFVAGADIQDQYIPFLIEELALEGKDPKEPKWPATITESQRGQFHVLIVGAGMSGILAGIRLKQAGVPFTIIDKNKDVGGTWLENAYPGCRVDNPNHMYSYSFEPYHDWPQHFSTQPVLHEYFRNVASKYGLRKFIRFETELVDAAFDDARSTWVASIRSADGRTDRLEANAIVTAVGQLNRPKLPNIKGVEKFKGVAFHSARWNHEADLKNKRIAVIGTGASAFQFIPEIAPDAKELLVFQRSAPWLGATPNYHENVAEGKKWLLKHVPFYAKWYRFWLFWMLTDGLYPMVQADPGWNGPTTAVSEVNQGLRELLVQYTKAQIANDDDLVRAAIPEYPVGGKRSVRDNGVWLAALQRPNVRVITNPVREITEDGLITADGVEHKVDVLVYGTGFYASHFLEPMKFKGRGGIDLHEQWDGDARAYLGMTVPNFPNLFMMYGPNTNIVVNGSIIFFSECETRYILGCIELLLKTNSAEMEVRKDVHDRFNERVDAQNARMAWGVPQVTSWYKNEKGRVSQNWPFPLIDYWKATLAPNPADFTLRKRTEAVAAAE
jgi:4-hydroxyacetophenone monooxygenase